MSDSFLVACQQRRADGAKVDDAILNGAILANSIALVSMPHTLLECILSYLQFFELGLSAATCRLFCDSLLEAADARRRRLGLRQPTTSEDDSSNLVALQFAEDLADVRAAAPSTLSTAENHSLLCCAAAVGDDGAVSSKLLSWGSGLHVGSTDQGHGAGPPNPVVGVDESLLVVSASAGLSHSVALTAAGQAFSWGYSGAGALGHELQEQYVSLQPLPRRIQALRAHVVVQAACSERHTLFLTAEGRVLSCGDGHAGRLGHGSAGPEPTPRLIELWQRPNIVKSSDDVEGQRHVREFAAGSDPSLLASRSGGGGGGSGGGGSGGGGSGGGGSGGGGSRADRLRSSVQGRDQSALRCSLPSPPRVTCVSAGEAHSLAISAPTGALYSWGLAQGGAR